MNHKTVWVTGAMGLIGSNLVRVLPKLMPGATIRGLGRADLDLTDFAAVENRFKRERPAVVFHCAAMSRSPDCEASPVFARKINAEATRVLSELAGDSQLVFLSSDQVFDGRSAPYDEDSRVNPLSVYAETKAEAETHVLRHPRHLVIRTSLNGGTSPTGDRGFNELMRNAWRAGKTLTLFTDEFRCPIAAVETANATAELALKNSSGIYHVAGLERLSRWELGLAIARRWPDLHPRLEAGSLADYKGPPRPPDLTLTCGKAMAALKRPLIGISQWLRTHPNEIF